MTVGTFSAHCSSLAVCLRVWRALGRRCAPSAEGVLPITLIKHASMNETCRSLKMIRVSRCSICSIVGREVIPNGGLETIACENKLGMPLLPSTYRSLCFRIHELLLLLLLPPTGRFGQASRRIWSPDGQKAGYRGQRRSYAESNGAGEIA